MWYFARSNGLKIAIGPISQSNLILSSRATTLDEEVAAHCLWCGQTLGGQRRILGSPCCSSNCLNEYNNREL
jgi:hypothetical protein